MKKAIYFLIPLFLIGLAAYLFVRLSKKRDYLPPQKNEPEDDRLNVIEEIYDFDEEGNPLFKTYYA
jgi:hypothetical protein